MVLSLFMLHLQSLANVEVIGHMTKMGVFF